MKRIVSVILAALLVSTVSAKNFFTDRYFEFQTSVPLGISNNAISFKDILQKEVVVDLREISSKLPNEGLVVTAYTNPTFGMNLRIAKLFIGVNTGVEVYDRFSVSRDLFDFLGKGNASMGDTLDVELKNEADAFYDVNIDVGLDFKRFNLHVKPTVFLPIASMAGTAGKVTFVNDEEGNVKFNLDTNADIYTAFDFNDVSGSLGSIGSGVGFDLGATVTLPIMHKLDLEVDARIPIVPGKLKYATNVQYSMTYDMAITDLGNAESTNTQNTESVSANYAINRPMKFDGYVDYYLLGSLLKVRGGLGFGVYHPFMETTAFYPEYYAGVLFNLANILKAGASMEYTDRIFINQLDFTINLRLIQIDAGVSMQAASFAKSFNGSGYGGFVVLSVGF